MKTFAKLILCFILLIVILGVLGVFWFYNKIAEPAVTPAFISELQGNVEVNRGHGNAWEAGVVDMELRESDSIRTNKGTAGIILRESVLVRLKEHTEGIIESLSKDNIRVRQTQGTIWSRFTRLFGVNSYQVVLPYTTATVRGTGFLSKVQDQDIIIVGEGTVSVANENTELSVSLLQKVVSRESVHLENLTFEDKNEITKDMADDVQQLKQLRWHIIHKYQWLIDQYKERYNITDEQISHYLDMIDRGELDENKLIEKSPVRLPALDRIKQITDLIKESQQSAAKNKREN